MIYLIAIIISLAVCAQGAASDIVARNITHLKNGREPNAAIALFPAIPFLQLLALGLAWVLERFATDSAIGILVGLFLLFFCDLASLFCEGNR